MKKEELKSTIRNVPDFPIKGIQFKDLTTMFMNASALKAAVDDLYEEYKDKGITKVVGLESRGFIIGPALAIRLNAGFIPIRKPGKLPYDTIKIEYKKEYGTDTIEIHTDSIEEKDVVLIHDDLLATGGTAEAAIKLVEKMKPQKIYACFIVELDNLKGRERIKCPTYSTLHYNE
ncbi:MAG: adenine phosphoribosyltransferase [Paludibacteraceae bacterium]|nr:adenine phosphoribosyltransferase [Paludibacteraceae bacterium]